LPGIFLPYSLSLPRFLFFFLFLSLSVPFGNKKKGNREGREKGRKTRRDLPGPSFPDSFIARQREEAGRESGKREKGPGISLVFYYLHFPFISFPMGLFPLAVFPGRDLTSENEAREI